MIQTLFESYVFSQKVLSINIQCSSHPVSTIVFIFILLFPIQEHQLHNFLIVYVRVNDVMIQEDVLPLICVFVPLLSFRVYKQPLHQTLRPPENEAFDMKNLFFFCVRSLVCGFPSPHACFALLLPSGLGCSWSYLLEAELILGRRSNRGFWGGLIVLFSLVLG